MLTFGDGVSDVDLGACVAFHESHGRLATITAVRPPARFGHVELDGDRVAEFSEKPQTGEGWINGGYMVLEREVLDYIDGDDDYFQREPMERLAADGQLMAYRHESLLAVHGHAARQASARQPVGVGTGPLEGVGLMRRPGHRQRGLYRHRPVRLPARSRA